MLLKLKYHHKCSYKLPIFKVGKKKKNPIINEKKF